MLVVIDNYDSFTYNLVHYLGELGEDIQVQRNDAISVAELRALRPSRLVVSPGPGRPERAGITVDAIRQLGPEIPTLGVCLGHQAVGYAFGGQVTRAHRPIHGKVSVIEHTRDGLFAGVPFPLSVGRYHSLIVADDGLPPVLEVTARSQDDGAIMAFQHRKYPIYSVQFHPESVLTPAGKQILMNFLRL